ncbi:MAG TPA: hypothetical protein VEI97_00140, partial [bacterium]|nr:hypothetical protein [bacterium]
MTQCTRWGVAALAALAIFAGCGGGDDSNPITDGQAVPARDPKFAPGLKIQGHPDNFPDHIGRARLSELRGRQGATNPFAPAPTLATPTGELTAPRAGFATGTLGTFRLEVDPDLTGRIVFPRTGQTQGDRYLLGIDQFFGPGKINVESITRGPDGTVDVTIAFTHPFPRPADLIGPPTATKRLDLHVFNVWAGILVQGTENYFSGTVTTNTRALRNPDTYRETGQLVNLPAGVTADAFPGKWVADQSAANTDPAQDNYDPADNGWVGAELQDPRGYGVFPQGATVPVTFQFDPEGNGGSISVDMAILADYQDPRATPAPKNNRLPDPLDPTKLRYILPFGAGDLQSIQTSITGDLPATGGTETVTVDIVDLDADAPVASGTWPNDANLNEMPFASDIQSVETSFNVTGVTASVPLPAAGSGDGTPGNPKKYEF